MAKPGDILILAKGPRAIMSAQDGARALLVENLPASKRVRVFWLDSLAGEQMNGQYSMEHFQNTGISMNHYRPDILPEHRSASTDPVDRLRQEVRLARKNGLEVEARVTVKKVVETVDTVTL